MIVTVLDKGKNMYYQWLSIRIKYLLAFTGLFFSLISHSPLFLFSQENAGRSKTIRHFILLVDTTGPVKSIFFPKNSNYDDERYFKLLKTALEKNPYNFIKQGDDKETMEKEAAKYRTFDNQRDIVTFVFFHFPLMDDGYIEGDQYFYTSKDLIAIENFSSSNEKIKIFLKEKNDKLKEFPQPTSPIEFAKKMAFPYLCEEYGRYKFPEKEKKIVENIVFIVVSDKKDVPINEDRFVKSEDKEEFKKWWFDFKQNFEYFAINEKPDYIFYDRMTGEVTQKEKWEEWKIYFDYILIRPKLKGLFWKTEERDIRLERVVGKSKNRNNVKIFWKGDSGITPFKMGNYKGFIEWAPGEESRSSVKWNTVRTDSAGEIFFDNIRSPSQIYIKKTNISRDVSQAQRDARWFNKSIFYRIAITDFVKKHKIPYPFQYRFYTDRKRITYISKELENNTYKIPSYFVHKMGTVKKEGVITDDLLTKLFQEYHGIVDDELSASTASEWSEVKAREQRQVFLLTAAVIASSFVVLLIIVLLFLMYVRNPKIRANIIQDINTREIPVDFSESSRETKELALLKLSNCRKPLSKRRKKKGFNLDLRISFSSNPGENLLDYESNQLLMIKKASEREDNTECVPLRKVENFYNVDLTDICAEDEFKILLNPNAIKDLDIDAEGIEVKTVPFKLALEDISGNFVQNRDLLRIRKVKNKRKDWSRSIILKFKPETSSLNIAFKKANEGENEDFVEEELDIYTIPYSASRPVQKLFKLTVANANNHKFSNPLEANISYKVLEGITPLETNDIFYLSNNPVWDGSFDPPSEYHISPGWGEVEEFYFYIKFGDMTENPTSPRNLQINILKDGIKMKKCTKNISVTRSREKTEALIRIEDEAGAASIENQDVGVFNQYNELIVNETSEDVVPLSTVVPYQGRKDIIESETTHLFTLLLKNNCKTTAGYYKWKIFDMKLKANDNISINEERKEEVIIVDHPEQTGNIPDIEGKFELIKFSLNNRMAKLTQYQLSFEITFKLLIEFFSEGKLHKEAKNKQVNVKTTINGCHRVIPNYLIIDFGTSAIAVENRDSSVGIDSEKTTNALPLKSLDGLIESEDGLLPSILNLNKDKVTGMEDFVNLPAEKSLISVKPELLLSAVKLMILEGEKKIPVPKGFQCLNENGESLEYGGFLDLGSIVKSAYKNLKNNYIKTHVKEYRKLILTYPNVYNETHKLFLKEILKEVFVNKEDSVYQENIVLVSESNAVLYDYLQQRSGDPGKTERESVLICDVGGGTLDISLADVTWEKGNEYPAEINIIDKDGIAFAGEVLDKAIALQVHRILLQYEIKSGMVEEPGVRGTQIFSTEMENQTEKKGAELRSTLRNRFYHRRIAEDGSSIEARELDKLLQGMFEFKYYHILQFKKDMSHTSSNDWVRICLGDNADEKGLCFMIMKGDEISLVLEFEGKTFDSYIKNQRGFFYLYLKKNDWLYLPYLKRYKDLFIEKIKLFFNTADKQLPGKYTVILSGRTSLWPGIPQAVAELFNVIPIYISGNDSEKKGMKLKRAVTEGALQKVVEWPHIKCREPKFIGIPALNYKNKAGSSRPGNWTVQTLKVNEPVKIDLNNSPHFQLGIKTSMDFIPFIGGACYERDRFCGQNKKIRVHLKPYDNVIGWQFFIQPDEEDRTTGKDKSKETPLIELPVDPRTETNALNLKGAYWPLKKVRLPDVDPKDFSECT